MDSQVDSPIGKQNEINQAYSELNDQEVLDVARIAPKIAKLPPVQFVLEPFQAVQIVGLLQLALRHPGAIRSFSSKTAEGFVKTIIDSYGELDPDVAKFLNLGFDSANDLSQIELTGEDLLNDLAEHVMTISCAAQYLADITNDSHSNVLFRIIFDGMKRYKSSSEEDLKGTADCILWASRKAGKLIKGNSIQT